MTLLGPKGQPPKPSVRSAGNVSMTILSGLRRYDLYQPSGDEILGHWKVGKDTLDIARLVGLPESEVANRLPTILERNRTEQEWNFDTLNGRAPFAARSVQQ